MQPLSADELQALPEGERKTKRMKAFSDFLFNTADQSTGCRGDWFGLKVPYLICACTRPLP